MPQPEPFGGRAFNSLRAGLLDALVDAWAPIVPFPEGTQESTQRGREDAGYEYPLLSEIGTSIGESLSPLAVALLRAPIPEMDAIPTTGRLGYKLKILKDPGMIPWHRQLVQERIENADELNYRLSRIYDTDPKYWNEQSFRARLARSGKSPNMIDAILKYYYSVPHKSEQLKRGAVKGAMDSPEQLISYMKATRTPEEIADDLLTTLVRGGNRVWRAIDEPWSYFDQPTARDTIDPRQTILSALNPTGPLMTTAAYNYLSGD